MEDDSEFTIAEMVEMKNIYKEIGEETLAPDFCKGLASSFSLSPNRAGKPAITWQQVHNWFQDKHKRTHPEPEATLEPLRLEFRADLPNGAAVVESAPLISFQKRKGSKAPDLSELIFEAKSSKDFAWYDVACFLNYRILYSGELEVRVRFAGFRNTEDEWVNLKAGVRERSIPLEPSECHLVKVGDLIMCFRERYEQAVYYDARIVEIRRGPHDSDRCDCIFLVRYLLDHAEDKVGLEWICRRPAGEESNNREEIQLPPKSIFF
ncbi:unnamed protein product [Linum tenue]|uniref:SAWADEE domain-containing protein n=1 Tax=Linum tenue TaxID=586396 RepID=A0AAV0KPN4_9ROSI|nr:unnamed protein product [Linum tenue]